MPPHRCIAPELLTKRALLRQDRFVLVALVSRDVDEPLTRQRLDRLLLLVGALEEMELVLGIPGVLIPFCSSRARATLTANSVVSVYIM